LIDQFGLLFWSRPKLIMSLICCIIFIFVVVLPDNNPKIVSQNASPVAYEVLRTMIWKVGSRKSLSVPKNKSLANPPVGIMATALSGESGKLPKYTLLIVVSKDSTSVVSAINSPPF
jgi:hypothetical protein